MELTGDVLIGAPRAKVWAGLNDPEVLTRCIPGCEAMEELSTYERTARVAVKVGPVRARFAGRIRMEDVRPEEGCVLHFEGSGGAAGMAKGHSVVELLDEETGTRLRYTAQASVGGKLGQVGGRMIDAAAKQMADQFFLSLTQHLAPMPAAADEPAGPSDLTAAPAAAPAVAAAPLAAAPARAPVVGAAPAAGGESQRVLWFALGSLSTGLGVVLGWLLFA
jgi:uncharacterized protein